MTTTKASKPRERMYRYFCLECELRLEVNEPIANMNCPACIGSLIKIPRSEKEAHATLLSLSRRVKDLRNFNKQMQHGMGALQREIIDLKAE